MSNDTAPAPELSASSSVVVAGATGAIGREFVIQAVSDDFFSRVVALSRRDIAEDKWSETWPGVDMEKARAKLKVYSIDWEGLCKGGSDANDIAVNCPNAAKAFLGHQYAVNLLGSTRKDAGSAEAFHRYDYDYCEAFVNATKAFNPATCSGPLSAAHVPATTTIRHFAQISSTGASRSSWLLYPRTKGLADENFIRKGVGAFDQLSIWRPGLLDRNDKVRSVEKFAMFFINGMPVGRVSAAIIASMKDPSAAKNTGYVYTEAVMGNNAPSAEAVKSAVRVFSNGEIEKMTPWWGDNEKKKGSGGCCSKDDTKEKGDL